MEDLPEAAKNYILIRAANLFAMRATGSTEVAKYSEREEANARAALIQYECDQGDYSVFSKWTRYESLCAPTCPLILSGDTDGFNPANYS